MVTNFCPGQIFVRFLTMFLKICQFQNKNDHVKKKLTTSCFHVSAMLSLPGYFRPFPAYFRPFPGNFRPEKSQSRARSAQKVRNTKLTTVGKKHDHFQLLRKKSAIRAQILQTKFFLRPFEDPGIYICISQSHYIPLDHHVCCLKSH